MLLVVITLVFVGGPVRCLTRSSDSSDLKKESKKMFEDDFYDSVSQMERQQEIQDILEEGVDNWEARCLRIAGEKALDNWLKAQEHLIYCVMNNFNVTTMMDEMNAKRSQGLLDLFFAHYCGEPVTKTRPCIEEFLVASRLCSGEDSGGKQFELGRNSLGNYRFNGSVFDLVLPFINTAVSFLCYNSGDRIALFMSEDGFECCEEHNEGILSCVNDSMPGLLNFNREILPDSTFFQLTDETCRRIDRVRICIERELLQCHDPTPSNIINSIILAMMKSTSCKDISVYPEGFVSSSASLFSLVRIRQALNLACIIIIYVLFVLGYEVSFI